MVSVQCHHIQCHHVMVPVVAIVFVCLAATLSIGGLILAALRPLPAALDASINVESMRTAFAGEDAAALTNLFDWERMRVVTAAKGLAGSAAGLIAAVVPTVLQHGLGLAATPYIIIVFGGAAIALTLAARAALNARQLGDQLVFAYALWRLVKEP
jgi:hypothetical protein